MPRADWRAGCCTSTRRRFWNGAATGFKFTLTGVVLGLSFSTAAGFENPGQTSTVKVYVVLTTGNERGSNAVSLTRPA